MLEQRTSWEESIFSFHCMGPRGRNQGVRLGSKLLSHGAILQPPGLFHCGGHLACPLPRGKTEEQIYSRHELVQGRRLWAPFTDVALAPMGRLLSYFSLFFSRNLVPKPVSPRDLHSSGCVRSPGRQRLLHLSPWPLLQVSQTTVIRSSLPALSSLHGWRALLPRLKCLSRWPWAWYPH